MKDFPKFSGDHPLVSALNRLVECVKERTPLRGKECEIDYFPDGFRPKPKTPPAQSEGGDQVWL